MKTETALYIAWKEARETVDYHSLQIGEETAETWSQQAADEYHEGLKAEALQAQRWLFNKLMEKGADIATIDKTS